MVNTYPHMCRMDHIEIGHSDSGEDERCPLCKALDEIEFLRRGLKKIADNPFLSSDVNAYYCQDILDRKEPK